MLPTSSTSSPGLEDLERRYDAAYEAKDLDELNRLEAEIWLDGPFHPGRVEGPARDLFLDMNRIALEAPEPGRAARRGRRLEHRAARWRSRPWS